MKWFGCIYSLLFIVLVLLQSCEASGSRLNAKKTASHRFPNAGISFQLYQRSDTLLQIGKTTVRIAIDDITHGQTICVIENGNRTVLYESIREGGVFSFCANNYCYDLKCVQLENLLIGNDFAYFKMTESGKRIRNETDYRDSIQLILQRMEQAKVVFVRNGSVFSSEEAALHLHNKYQQVFEQVHSVDQFIAICAARSSVSGTLYLVRLPDGREMPCATWIRKELIR